MRRCGIALFALIIGQVGENVKTATTPCRTRCLWRLIAWQRRRPGLRISFSGMTYEREGKERERGRNIHAPCLRSAWREAS